MDGHSRYGKGQSHGRVEHADGKPCQPGERQDDSERDPDSRARQSVLRNLQPGTAQGKRQDFNEIGTRQGPYGLVPRHASPYGECHGQAHGGPRKNHDSLDAAHCPPAAG